MTVIAFDGVSLAADKRSLGDYVASVVTKIYRLSSGDIVAFAGDAAPCMVALRWFESGEDGKWPEEIKDPRDVYAVLWKKADRTLWKYEGFSAPFRIESTPYACGHGRDFAIAAMGMGLSAEEACVFAAKYDLCCGNGVDVMTLEEPDQ